jgi:hypothetical protein
VEEYPKIDPHRCLDDLQRKSYFAEPRVGEAAVFHLPAATDLEDLVEK